MDNYTLIQNATQRRLESERTGFAALSRQDQADRWAAWQASADATRSARDLDDYIAPQSPEPEPEPARWAGEAQPPAPNPTPNPNPPAPPRRSFELYNGIMARHHKVFGPQT